MYTIDDVKIVSKILNISFDKFSPNDLLRGMNIEKEHGLVNNLTNVTNDNILLTAKIALAHLLEYPNYYNDEYGLLKYEEYLKSKLESK